MLNCAKNNGRDEQSAYLMSRRRIHNTWIWNHHRNLTYCSTALKTTVARDKASAYHLTSRTRNSNHQTSILRNCAKQGWVKRVLRKGIGVRPHIEDTDLQHMDFESPSQFDILLNCAEKQNRRTRQGIGVRSHVEDKDLQQMDRIPMVI